MALDARLIRLLTCLLLQGWLCKTTRSTTATISPSPEGYRGWSMPPPSLHVSATRLTQGQKFQVSCNLTYPASFPASLYIGLEQRPPRQQKYQEVGSAAEEEMTDAERIFISTSYTVKRVAQRHAGHYRCWAWNSQDDAVVNSPEVLFRVASSSRPRLRVFPRQLTEGDNLHAHCSVTHKAKFLVMGLEYKLDGQKVYQPLVDNQVVETTPANCSCMSKTATREVKVVVGKQHGGLIRCWVQRLEKNVQLRSRPVRVIVTPRQAANITTASVTEGESIGHNTSDLQSPPYTITTGSGLPTHTASRGTETPPARKR